MITNSVFIAYGNGAIFPNGEVPLQVTCTGLQLNNRGTIVLDNSIAMDYTIEYETSNYMDRPMHTSELFANQPFLVKLGDVVVARIDSDMQFNGFMLKNIEVNPQKITMDIELQIINTERNCPICIEHKLSISHDLVGKLDEKEDILIYRE